MKYLLLLMLIVTNPIIAGPVTIEAFGDNKCSDSLFSHTFTGKTEDTLSCQFVSKAYGVSDKVIHAIKINSGRCLDLAPNQERPVQIFCLSTHSKIFTRGSL